MWIPVLDGPVRVRVVGQPTGGPEALAAALRRGDGGTGGPWAAVVERPGEPPEAWAAPFGGRPLFTDGRQVALEPAALDLHARPVDARGVHQHLHLHPVEPSLTLAFGIRRLPAGHRLRLDGRLRFQRAWQLQPAPLDRSPAAALRAAIERAVGSLPLAGPAAIALSGGLDSSVLALALAQRGPVRALSNRFPGWAADEGPYLTAVCEAGGLPRVDVDSRALDPVEVLDRLGPPGFPPLIPSHHLNLALLHRAPELVLGFGGDEVIGHGFGLPSELLWGGRPLRAAWELAWLGARFRHGPGEPVRRWVRRYLATILRGPADPVAARRADLLNPWTGRARDELGELAAAMGAVIHTPLLDPELARIALAIPDAARLRRGLTRRVLREAFADRLPPVVANRADKADLSQSFVEPWLAGLPARWAEIDAGALDRWLPPPARARLRRQAEAGEGTAATALWRALGAARWLAWHTGPG